MAIQNSLRGDQKVNDRIDRTMTISFATYVTFPRERSFAGIEIGDELQGCVMQIAHPRKVTNGFRNAERHRIATSVRGRPSDDNDITQTRSDPAALIELGDDFRGGNDKVEWQFISLSH
jgi:hypothetical protein